MTGLTLRQNIRFCKASSSCFIDHDNEYDNLHLLLSSVRPCDHSRVDPACQHLIIWACSTKHIFKTLASKAWSQGSFGSGTPQGLLLFCLCLLTLLVFYALKLVRCVHLDSSAKLSRNRLVAQSSWDTGDP